MYDMGEIALGHLTAIVRERALAVFLNGSSVIFLFGCAPLATSRAPLRGHLRRQYRQGTERPSSSAAHGMAAVIQWVIFSS